MDYKQLLVKYIEYVKYCGSCDFILKLDQPYVEFTKEETEELNNIVDAIFRNNSRKN